MVVQYFEANPEATNIRYKYDEGRVSNFIIIPFQASVCYIKCDPDSDKELSRFTHILSHIKNRTIDPLQSNPFRVQMQ